MSAITLFEEKQVRRAWNAAEEKWYFAIVDVIAILTNSPNPQVYWRVMKKRLLDEGNETVTNCHGLKMTDADGTNPEEQARKIDGGQPSRLSRSAAVSAAVAKVGTGPAHEHPQSEQARRPFSNTAGTAMLRFGGCSGASMTVAAKEQAPVSSQWHRRSQTAATALLLPFSLSAFSTMCSPSCSYLP